MLAVTLAEIGTTKLVRPVPPLVVPRMPPRAMVPLEVIGLPVTVRPDRLVERATLETDCVVRMPEAEPSQETLISAPGGMVTADPPAAEEMLRTKAPEVPL